MQKEKELVEVEQELINLDKKLMNLPDPESDQVNDNVTRSKYFTLLIDFI